ncbi:MAG: hypothetical protein WAV16_03870 [Candidatus Moraniibacteriota bacterium]
MKTNNSQGWRLGDKFKLTFRLGILTLVFLFSTAANAQGSYWKNYFSSGEQKAIEKNSESYTLSQIESKSGKWKGIIRGYNIKNGSIDDEDIKDNGISTDKISGLDEYIDQRISGNSTPQDFAADRLTGSYAALNGSQITNLSPANITGSGNLNIGNGDLFVNDTSGNVGIGMTSPSQQLQLTGNFRMPATTSTNGIIYSDSNLFLHGYGTANLFLGKDAGNLTTTGSGFNIGMGDSVLNSNTTGTANTSVGYRSMDANTTGDRNAGFGEGVLNANISGSQNTAIGMQASHQNTTGGNRTTIGWHASEAGNADYITAVGSGAMEAASTAAGTVAVGALSLSSVTSGENNVAVGYLSLNAITTTHNNTAVGYETLYQSTGGWNTVMGRDSGLRATTANFTTAIGDSAGSLVTTGSYNSLFGYSANVASGGGALTNATAIGAQATVSASNSLVLGSINGINGATSNVNVGIGTTAPVAALDVNGQVKMKVESAQPFACDATHSGTIALTSTFRTCVCKGPTTTWVFTTDGTTTCTW